MTVKTAKTRILTIVLTAILILGTAVTAYASETPQITRTRPWDSITETLGGIPESVQKIEKQGTIFYLAPDVPVEYISLVLAGSPAMFRLATADDVQRMFQNPIYILWNADRTTLLVHPIIYVNDMVLEAVAVTPTSQGTTSTTNTPAQETTITTTAQPRTTPIFFDEVTLLNSEELTTLAETAPTFEETRSASTLPDRRLTESEFADWAVEYLELGGINAFELEVVRLINEERAKHRLQPLAIMPHYMQAARFRSQEMVDLNYRSHTSPVYGSPGAVVNSFGRNMGLSETIAGGSTPSQTVTAWLNSPGHRRILLSSGTGAIGVGIVPLNQGFRATALFISGDAQYIGHEVTINGFLGR